MGCTSAQVSNQRLEAMVWYYGKRECRSIQFVDDVAGSVAGESFDVNVIDENYEEQKYLFWLSDGVASAPTPAADQTLVAVSYTQDDDAATIAAAFKAAVDAYEVLSEISGGVVEVQNKFLGVITAEVNTNAPSFTFTQNQAGTGGALGAIAPGGVTISTEQSLQDILRDDEGDVIQDQIIKGASVSGELAAAEMTQENWESLVGSAYGSIHTEGADDLVGFGTDKLYKSSFSYAGQLVGHPKRLPFSDRSADVVIWKTVANMSDINYSGQDVQIGNMSFQALPDRTKPDAINLFARGDHSLL